MEGLPSHRRPPAHKLSTLPRRRRICLIITTGLLILAVLLSYILGLTVFNPQPTTTPPITHQPASNTSRLFSNFTMEHKAHLLANMDFNNLAIALKSGSETFPKRTPAQFETFLKAVHNVLVIGEKGGVSDVHGRRMFDVYHGALDAAKVRLGPKGVRFAESRMGKLKLDLSDQGSTPMQGQVGRDQGGKSAADTVQAGWFNNEGWVSDAHKNLPGFALLYKEFPEAEWFLMIDDDSYVFVENLHNYLKQFNPDKKYYMGQANKFQGCDDVAVMGMGPPIAQGGTGILMSRGAIKALLKIVDQCTVQYQECWAGDVRVGLCLRDAGIHLKHTPGFNGWPPQANFVFSPDACEVPFTYHHVLSDQMYILHKIEQEALATHTPLTSAHMYHTFLHPLPATYPRDTKLRDPVNSERKGKPFMNFHIASWEDCESRCLYYTECVGWFWDGKDGKDWCWLKRTPGGLDEKVGGRSGVIPGRYRCERGMFR